MRLLHPGDTFPRLTLNIPGAQAVQVPGWLAGEFGVVKKAVSPNDFDSLGQLSRALLGFADRYNQTARPFSWKFTASDLHDLMNRISRHEQQDDPQGRPLPQAA